MAAVSPPHSPPPPPPPPPHQPPRSPSSPHSPYQHLADADHCFLPTSQHSTSPVLPSRTRSGSRTYDEAQADDRRQHLARQRTRSRERAAAEDALVGRKSSSEHGQPGAYHHAGDEMSAHELRAEMETLMLLRRRSMSQPVADPDLPPTPPPTSAPSVKRPNLTLAIPTINEHPGGGPVSPTAPSPAETGTLVRRRSTAGGRLPSEHPLPSPPPVPSPSLQFPHSTFSSPSSSSAESDELASSPASFWLPASLHPELAPAEFKAFIREQTRPEALARRTSLSAGGGSSTGTAANHGSASAGRPTRRASLLRGEYKPRVNDGVGDDERRERPPPVPRIDEEHLVKRTTSDGAAAKQRRSRNTLNFEELTIKDLQRLEELAAKAEAEGNTEGEEEEGERLGRVLRRSLSLNPHRVAAAAAAAGASFGGGTLPSTVEEPAGVDNEGSEPSLDSHDGSVNDEEAPIIVFAPGQILRRNARTRIRKTSTGGTETAIGFGGGSRYGSGRRKGRSSTGDASIETGESGGAGGEGGWGASAEGPLTASSEGGEAGESASPPSSDQQHIEVATLPVEDEPHVVQQQQQQPPALPPKSEQAPLPTVVVDRPHVDAPLPPPVPAPAPPLQHVHVDAPALVVAPPAAAEPTSPTSPTRNTISPASAEYDWATHHQPAPPPPPSPAPEPQYTAHPQHLPRQPFGEVPPPQAVPVPLPQQRKEPPAPSPSPPPAPAPAPARSQSPKPAAKEKKSGWARLGLGRDDDKKRKGKGRDRSDDGASTTSASSHGSGGGGGDKESSGGGSGGSGFLSGIFGRSKRGGSAEHEPPAPPRAPSPPPEPRIPPPPPTASGVLLPNGRYANFYRLPIHVERAVYRLSHIKLANPRRPLYEQVLISNLMFWYLGLIQKPVAPPPAAAPVPVPGLPSPSPSSSSSLPNGVPASPSPHGAPTPSSSPAPAPPAAGGAHSPSPSQQSHKRGGLSKPSRAAAGARPAAEMPMRTVSYEVQNQQLLVEEQRERYQLQHQQLGQGPPPGQGQGQYSALPSQQQGNAATGGGSSSSSSRSSGSRSLFAPPLSSTSAATGPDPAQQQQRSPERASAPAAMYAAGAGDDDDDRPLALAQHAHQQQQPTRESFPPTRGASQVPPTSSSSRPGFEVTSRRVSGGSITSAEHAYAGWHDDGGALAQHDPSLLASSSASAKHERRASAMSDRSFDAGEIYDAYAPGSPGLVSGPGASSLFGPPSSSGAGGAAPPVVALETPPGAVLGAVAPRGSSLRAFSR